MHVYDAKYTIHSGVTGNTVGTGLCEIQARDGADAYNKIHEWVAKNDGRCNSQVDPVVRIGSVFEQYNPLLEDPRPVRELVAEIIMRAQSDTREPMGNKDAAEISKHWYTNAADDIVELLADRLVKVYTAEDIDAYRQRVIDFLTQDSTCEGEK